MNLYEYIERYGEDPRDLDEDEGNARCLHCGATFTVEWLPATRTDPACPARDYECPECGSEDWESD